MINNLKVQCERWNLTLNMTKSTIIVIRKGRLAQTENWYHGRERIETVIIYMYLDVTLTLSSIRAKI